MSGDDDDDADDSNPDGEGLLDGSGLLNAASPAETRKRRSRADLREEENRQWWLAALAHEVGRRCLWGILADAHAFDERFACGPNGFPQPEATWFHAGEQSFGLRLYHRLMLRNPEAVMAMHRENDPRFIKTREIK